MMDDEQRPFRVLTLDGGGMRGLYTAALLKQLAARFDARYQEESPDLGRAFDLICGTSTGSILACALAAGIPLNTVCELYQHHGDSIFPDPMPGDSARGGWRQLFIKPVYRWSFRHRSRPAGNAEVLRSQLTEAFGSETLNEVYTRRGIGVCIPTVDASNHQAVVLKTPHLDGKQRDNRISLVDACMASSAAPIFLPLSCSADPIEPSATHCYADGGLWANNPVLVGLIEAMRITAVDRPIQVVSVGTCASPTGDPAVRDAPERGLLHWRVGVKIIEASMTAQATGQAYTAEILAECLRRAGRDVDVVRLKENQRSPNEHTAIGLDRADASAIQTLFSLARTDASLIHGDCTRNPSRSSQVLASIFSTIETMNQHHTENSHAHV